jgi:DNA-binding transcriptional MocR family regulator
MVTMFLKDPKMSQWTPVIDHKKGPRYLAIADEIGQAIECGDLKAGEKLPTHRDLAYDLGVTVGTVSRAYNEAVRRGYVIGEVGRGTYVKGDVDDDIGFQIPDQLTDGSINFSMNFPCEVESVEHFRRALMIISQDPGIGALMRYQSHQGMRHHREALAKLAQWQGAPYAPERIVMSNGVQNAMTLSLMSLMKAGDTLLCEEYSYPGIKMLATQLGVKMQGVGMDEHGIIPERLEEAIIQTGAKVIYCMPSCHNPTNVTMPLKRRQAIVNVAKRHGLWIIEDDIYGFLHDGDDDIVPFAQLLPEQTLYLNGASKCLSPGLRVGFVMAPESKLQTLCGCVQLSNWMVAPLNGEITARWIEDGTAEHLIRWHREEAARRQEIVRKYLPAELLHTSKQSYHSWLEMPKHWSPDMFCLRAGERGVSVIASHTFYVGRHTPINAIRICFGAPHELETVERGMQILGALLNEELPAFQSVM